ncbi:hypothetical protein EDB84DRAFT_335682 [Lactarius hengduanensis]|nr:hypothetical protein EDB84DRAFT_335682 [Lactarius hengduanensis]
MVPELFTIPKAVITSYLCWWQVPGPVLARYSTHTSLPCSASFDCYHRAPHTSWPACINPDTVKRTAVIGPVRAPIYGRPTDVNRAAGTRPFTILHISPFSVTVPWP